MRVFESGTDRKAEIHAHREGKVAALEEYGEYIDAKDQALCCYISVAKDDKLKIRCIFSGTTLTIAYDGIIDGVLRKATIFKAQKVSDQKNRRLDLDTFLFKSETGIIDTTIIAKPLSGATTLQAEALETIGTIELRLYVTRQLGVFHDIGNVLMCSGRASDVDNASIHTAKFKRVEPTFKMYFEQDCALLDKGKLTREQNRMTSRRPGRGPWAIFRFHYRNNEAILRHNLMPTFNIPGKVKTEPHCLLLDSVPPLPLGAKPQKDEGDALTRACSSVPSDDTSEPAKFVSKTLSSKTQTAAKKSKSIPSAASSIPLSSNTKKDQASPHKSVPSPAGSEDSFDQLVSNVISNPSSKLLQKDTIEVVPKSAPRNTAVVKPQNPFINCGPGSVPAGSEKGGGKDKVTRPSQEPLNKDKQTKNITQESIERQTSNGAAKASDLMADKNTESLFMPESPIQAQNMLNTAFHVPDMIPKNPVSKSDPIITALPSIETAFPSPETPLTPTKRLPAFTDDYLDLKRAKIQTMLNQATYSIPKSRLSTVSASPKPIYIECQVAEQRKRLAELRQKRKKMAEKQSVIDKQMEPYQKRMEEELERVKQELMEEENALAEEENQYEVSLGILNSFKKENGDN